MFFEISKQKVFTMIGIASFILIGIVASFFANRSFNISKHFDVVVMQSKANVTYVWQKLKMIKKEEGRKAFAFNVGDAGTIAATIFGGIQYFESTTGSHVPKARSIPVLTYHGLPSEGEGNVPFESFISHMSALKKAGWRTVTLSQFSDFIHYGSDLPDKSFLLTFDDGRKDTYYPVDPVLRDLGFKAVMFVITGQSLRQDPTKESEYYLSSFELQKMLNNGRWELGSHTRKGHEWYQIDADGTMAHFLSNKLWLVEEGRLETEEEFTKRISIDVLGAKSDIEFVFGYKAESFAFPFSDFGEESVNFSGSEKIIDDVVRANYELAFYQGDNSKGDSFNYPDPEAFMIKRIEPLPHWSAEKLMQVMDSGRVKDLPYESNSFGEEWRGSWGNVVSEQALFLETTAETTGAAVALSGSYLWQDYVFKANVEGTWGNNVLLVARYKDNDNYYACDFSTTRVGIKQRIDGVLETVALQNNIPYILGNSVELGIIVEGDKVSCLIEDDSIVSARMTGGLKNGGIGVHVWNNKLGEANLTVHGVEVTGI